MRLYNIYFSLKLQMVHHPNETHVHMHISTFKVYFWHRIHYDCSTAGRGITYLSKMVLCDMILFPCFIKPLHLIQFLHYILTVLSKCLYSVFMFLNLALKSSNISFVPNNLKYQQKVQLNLNSLFFINRVFTEHTSS